jgi:hypothetical protein
VGRIQDDRCNHRFFRPSSFSEAKPLNGYFPELVETLGKLNSVAVLDGEVVVLDEEDRSHFELLRQ